MASAGGASPFRGNDSSAFAQFAKNVWSIEANRPKTQFVAPEGDPLFKMSDIEYMLGPAFEDMAREKRTLIDQQQHLENRLRRSSEELREALNDANGLKLLHSEMRRRQNLSSSTQSELTDGQVQH